MGGMWHKVNFLVEINSLEFRVFFLLDWVQLAGAVKYTNCISAEG